MVRTGGHVRVADDLVPYGPRASAALICHFIACLARQQPELAIIVADDLVPSSARASAAMIRYPIIYLLTELQYNLLFA